MWSSRGDLVTDTGRSDDAPEPSTPRLKYNVYFSYGEADEERVREISVCLQAVDPQFRWFDKFEMVPGRSEIETREQALKESASLAVLLGPDRPSRLAEQEMKQGVSRAIWQSMPAFFVYLPGAEIAGEAERSWLGGATSVDLREKFDESGRLTRAGLVDLIAAVRDMNFREADEWLVQQEASPPGTSASPPRLRAMIVGFRDYQHYPPLLSARADVKSLEQLLRSAPGESPWDLSPFGQGTKDDLANATRSFFSTGATHDTLLFYFSGHGEVVDRDLYLVVRTTEPDDIMITAFPIKALVNYVKSSPARQKVIILDCCYSGEAAEGTDWGTGSAVLMTSPQVVPTGTGMSDLTRAITAAWQGGAVTTGDLLDGLENVDVRRNREFDRSIPLPRAAGAEPPSAADSPPSARLSFNERGELYVSLSPEDAGSSHRVNLAGWDDRRQHLVTNLIDMVDAVVSLVPPEKLPVDSVKEALLSLGSDLLSSTLTEAVRSKLGDALYSSPQLRLELSFDDRWKARDAWERLPWESLLLCKDGDRSVWLERIVQARDTKSTTRRRPSRVIAWNAFTEQTPQYASKAMHLLTHLLRAEVAHHAEPPRLVVKERAQWGELYQSTISQNVEGCVDQQPGASPERIPITDFDTFVLFAPVSLSNRAPVVGFPNGAAWVSSRASQLADLLKQWRFSYLIIETIAGHGPLQGTSEPGWSRTRSLQATTQLATELARVLGVTVVAVCHLPSFIGRVRPAEGEEMTFIPSFTGQFLRQLADSSLTPSTAAQDAHRRVVEGLGLENPLEIGLPVVCRPEPDRPGARPAPSPIQPSLSAPWKRAGDGD